MLSHTAAIKTLSQKRGALAAWLTSRATLCCRRAHLHLPRALTRKPRLNNTCSSCRRFNWAVNDVLHLMHSRSRRGGRSWPGHPEEAFRWTGCVLCALTTGQTY